MCKRHYESKHAKRRAKQRYGIDFNRKMRHEFLELIHTKQAQFIQRLTNTRSLFKINNCFVVYNKNTKNIITFLHPEWIDSLN